MQETFAAKQSKSCEHKNYHPQVLSYGSFAQKQQEAQKKIPVKKEPVERGEYSRETSGLKSLMTGKIKDAIDPSMLKVNPKYQKRVNKVLGE